jgi:hypothetical protein
MRAGDIITLMAEHIVTLLIQERDRLNRAIEALQGPAKRRGRPPKDPLAAASEASAASNAIQAANLSAGPGAGAPKKRKPFSAATKRKMARAQKKRWATLKALK